MEGKADGDRKLWGNARGAQGRSRPDLADDRVSYLTVAGIYLPEILGGRSKLVRDFIDRYPELRGVPELYRPLPTAVLLAVAFVFLWWARGFWLRFAGYTSIVLALGVGAVIYFLNGGLGGIQVGPIPKALRSACWRTSIRLQIGRS